MVHARSLSPAGLAPSRQAGVLSRLIYRSRAVHAMSPSELHGLALAAQSRNRAEGITGLVIYNEGRFFQWLEGPASGLGRVVQSIRHDPRHTDMRILDSQSGQTRLFGDWSMKLATTTRTAASWQKDVIEPPAGLIAELQRTPDDAARLLALLRPAGAQAGTGRRAAAGAALDARAAEILRTIVVEAVIPAIPRRRGIAGGGTALLPRHGQADAVADLLAAGDQDAARALIDRVGMEAPLSLRPFATLFEPVARRLGDLWRDDICSEFDITLGLSCLQTAARFLGARVPQRATDARPGPAILIVPQPGEPHGLGVTLDSEVLWHRGWNPVCDFPGNDVALQDLLGARWFDVLDLSLSAVFRRADWLPRLRATIAAARRASRNPALAVVVGGRLFADHLAFAWQAGADAASVTALDIDTTVVDGWRHEGDASFAA